MKRGARIMCEAFRRAGYRALPPKPGEKLFPFIVGEKTIFVKNTDKLSISVHPELESVVRSFPHATKVCDYKNSNQDGFPAHTPTTNEKYGVAADFETTEAAIRLAGLIEGSS